MATQTYEEVLRFLIEAKGDEDVGRLAREILSLGEAGEEAQGKTAALLDEFGKARGLSRTATDFRELGTQIIELGQRYDATRVQIQALTDDMAKVDEPTARQQSQLKRLTGELEKTGAQLAESKDQWRAQRAELEASGIATKRYSDLQSQIAAKQQQTSTALRTYAAELLKTRDATTATTQRLADQDEAFRRQATSSKIARDALDQYRARTAAAAKEQQNLTASASTSIGVLSKLRTVAAAALGFISFRSVIAGIQSIVEEGSNAEQELGQLEAVLQSTGRSSEFAADELANLAKKLASASQFSAGEITNAETRLLSYTNVAREEFPAAMQIVIDQSARLGIGLEQSAEIVGKALQTPSKAMESLGKQGFVLSDSQKQLIKQLEATGQTAKAQTIIMDLLVESYGGAAAKQKIGTIAGLWKSVQESFKDFQQEIAERGVLDYFKQQISDLLETGKELAADGTLSRWAQQTSDAIVAVANSVKGTTQFLANHYQGLLLIARGYAALKLGMWIASLNTMRIKWLEATTATLAYNGALDATASKADRLRGAIKAIPTQIKIAVALVGIDWSINQFDKLREAITTNRVVGAQQVEQNEELAKSHTALAAKVAATKAKYAEFSNEQILSGKELSALSAEELASYQQRLAGARRYYQAISVEAKMAGDAVAMKAADDAIRGIDAALAKLPQRLIDAKTAAAAMSAGITPAAQLILESLEGIDANAKLAVTSIKTLFDGLNYADSTALGDVALALVQVAQQGAGADKNIRDGLLATLQQLTSTELLRFQQSAVTAFDAMKKGPAEVAAILDTTLIAAMQKLGISTEQMGLKFTQAGADATAAFSTILENANATSAQIGTAFTAALSKVSTLDEAKALGNLLLEAGQKGKLGFEEAEQAAAALHNRIADITNAIDPLADQFSILGIKSQAALNATRDAARAAFDSIREGASRGEASIEDVRRAFAKYAETARAAAADSDQWKKVRVDGELAVLESIYNVNTGLDEMRKRGKASGDAVAGGAHEAAGAMDDLASATESTSTSSASASDGLDDVSESAGKAGKASKKTTEQAKDMSAALMGVSDSAIKSLMGLNKYAGSLSWSKLWNLQMSIWHDQKNQFDEMNKSLDKQLAKLVPANKEMEELRDRFGMLDDATLSGAAEKLQQIRQQIQQQQQAADQARKAAEDAAAAARQQAFGDSKDAAALAQPLHDTLTIEFKAPSKSVATSASAADLEYTDRIVGLVAPRLLQMIQRSRSISIRRHR